MLPIDFELYFDHKLPDLLTERLQHGKHVCVQKPLVNRIWEANQLHLAAKKKGPALNAGPSPMS